MSEYKAIKSNKLSFKGDPEKKKKKKRKNKEVEEEIESTTNDSGWVFVDKLDELVGPIFILFNGEPVRCLRTNDREEILSQPQEQPIAEIEPDQVHQVFVGRRVPGSDAFTFKSSAGKYLSCDKVGVLSIDSEAVGPQENWTPILRDDGISFQNVHGKYLSIEEAGGKLRGDSEEIRFCEVFRVKCQASARKKVKTKEKGVQNSTEAEYHNIRRFQSWGLGRVVLSKEDKSELKKAKKEGNFSETLLDRRSKLKSDRYCK
ncbi:hypothetical protein K493DRAFT_302228 [Basidiobolus meristosporus CBS 931.73]|uniref:Actin-crosslinking protein n=1 Tax=Basidiobolus meristosporus CBS 931.73 TaxID=1314790 RepID=A0A1Y1XW64_9FUNG|nr:hypothetical protein K493DRAFT_305664 [Basidiobolus meristosporus CBS 931.73]ORX94161.1 hypothetical protein K493DRAFT_302228 [Basidiobolus meristosporus CBS 931.73]|eukprot:ORX89564.1 hypothetical protein K493DRAFT_305664 [Basidiobolus meristosporus CBS 931.73]